MAVIKGRCTICVAPGGTLRTGPDMLRIGRQALVLCDDCFSDLGLTPQMRPLPPEFPPPVDREDMFPRARRRRAMRDQVGSRFKGRGLTLKQRHAQQARAESKEGLADAGANA